MRKLTREQLYDLHRKVSEGTASATEVELFSMLRKASAQKSFPYYCERMYAGELQWMWFQKYLMQRLQMIFEKGSGFLIVEMPPQHAKTTIASSLSVSYLLGRWPSKRVVLGAYNAERAKDNCRLIANEMAKTEYKKIFDTRNKKTIEEQVENIFNPDLKMDGFSFNVSNNNQGSFFATSIGGALTGKSADVLVLDDYNKDAQSAKSPVERETCYNWFQTCFMTRKQPDTIIIVFATRWHDDDLIGRLKKLKALDPVLYDFEVISFPSEKLRDDKELRPYDTREVGGYLWDDPRKIKDYEQQKKFNYEQYAALFLQEPVTEIGVIFQKSWFNFYYQMPEHLDRYIISCDTSYGAGTTDSDDCAITVHGQKGADWYLIEFIARRMGYVETKSLLRMLQKKYNDIPGSSCRHIVIENKSNGGAVIEELTMEMDGIISFEPGIMSKRARAELVTPVFVAGNYHIPSKELCPDIEYFLTQFLQFTGEKGGKDDCVDSVTQMLLMLGDLEYRISMDSCYSIQSMASRYMGNGTKKIGINRQNQFGGQKNLASTFVKGHTRLAGKR